MMTNRSIRAANPSFLVRYFLPGAAATLLLAALAGAAPEARQAGGEPDGIVQVANLVYAGTKSSHCFSDHFLIKAEKETSISTSRRFHAVKLSSEAMYEFPLVDHDRRGRFPVVRRRAGEPAAVHRAGAASSWPRQAARRPDWDRAFRREMATVFPSHPLQGLDLSHPVFHMVYDIKELRSDGGPRPLGGSASAAGWAWSTRRMA